MSIEQISEEPTPAPQPALTVVRGDRVAAAPPKTADFRLAIIGFVAGFVLVGGAVFAAGMVGGIGIGSATGLAIWLAFWGGGGFGFMLLGGLPPRPRRHT